MTTKIDDLLMQQNNLFGQNSWWLKVFLIIMFILAALIRRDEIQAPGHLIEREYNSAIFAHAFYADNNHYLKQWQKDIAVVARDQLPMLEPPLTEYLVSLIYRVVGIEHIWYARYLTGLFWLLGGIFLFKIVQILTSAEAALVATGYYLFLPWSIIISRSFQPDSLMMMLLLISLFFIVLFFKEPTWKRLVSAAVITGLALLLRPLVLFTLLGAFLALSIYKNDKKWWQFIDRQFIVFIFISFIFPLIFYGYGIFITGFLKSQADLSFRPYLLPRLEFWKGWFELSTSVMGYPFLISAILGFFTLRDRLIRYLIVGLTTGYIVFGLFFTYHAHTHPYYHIQTFPIIALAGAPFVVAVVYLFRRMAGGNWWIPTTLILVAVLYSSWSAVRNTLYAAVFEDAILAKEVGNLVEHSPHVVFVAYHYGLPLEYYGEIAGAPWPVRIDDPFYRRPDARELSVKERIGNLGFVPDYFVITNFDLYNRKHQDLKEFLESNCAIYAQTDQYLIYGSCQNLTSL